MKLVSVSVANIASGDCELRQQQRESEEKRGRGVERAAMATCGSILSFCGARPQLPPATTAAAATASPSFCPSLQSLPLRRRTTTCSATKARPPMPPLNPRDPFLATLASVAAASPEPLTSRPASSDPGTPPYLDLFENPKLMATPAQVERSVSYNEHRPRKPPPDLPSLLLHGRIVYIGMPLVPAVTELVIAELLYLQWMDPKQPIYLYINSTGTTRDDGETVGMESEGFAIYDAMMQLKNEVDICNILFRSEQIDNPVILVDALEFLIYWSYSLSLFLQLLLDKCMHKVVCASMLACMLAIFVIIFQISLLRCFFFPLSEIGGKFGHFGDGVKVTIEESDREKVMRKWDYGQRKFGDNDMFMAW
ncbi:hypothetical protein Taro_047571 [Colocasia esculenta]|uniref:ATP-dependent Clp protease proteolytic subunit n=1 Tax=Colocasia esculenta TaxID=4460 RepID=A0A843WVS3_COLES|nr:hypothetical protein [Colocasia esculenta]